MQITDGEKKILAQWVPGVDLSKVKIRAGPRVDRVCSIIGVQAITIGHRVFAASKSWIMRYPPGHPVRMALLVHELLHIKQETRITVPFYLIMYLAIFFVLSVFATVSKYHFWKISMEKFSRFNAKHNPFEKPAYRLQAEFLEQYWTEKEAEKWKGVTPK